MNQLISDRTCGGIGDDECFTKEAYLGRRAGTLGDVTQNSPRRAISGEFI